MTDPMIDPFSEKERQLINHGWPWPLAKATLDHFDYAIGLRDGIVIRFVSAMASDDMNWVIINHDGLKIARWSTGGDWRADHTTLTFHRGLVIRVSEIVWAADAPAGS